MLGITPSTPTTDNSVLIIIDAQNEYANGKLAVTNERSSRDAITALLHKYRDAKAPVIHVVHATPEGAPIFTPGTELAEEFKELTPLQGENIVKKQFPGSFTGTELEKLLKESGRDKIVLVGYMVRSPDRGMSRENGKTRTNRSGSSFLKNSANIRFRHMYVFPQPLARVTRGAGMLLWWKIVLVIVIFLA